MTIEQKSLELKKRIVNTLSPGAQCNEALCFADALAALSLGVMRVRPEEPDWEDRDRLILSAGSADAACRGAGLCADAVAELPGEAVAIGVDMALKARADIKIYRSFVMISQADCLSGKLWESAIQAHENMLEDLTVILCRKCDDILPGADNICARFSAFGFDTFSVEGDNVSAIGLALSLPRHSGKPLFVCCDVK